MEFVPYKDMTQEEKDQQQEVWVSVLNTFCSADGEGCRPCDYSMPCDRCHYDWDLQKEYAEVLEARGLRVPDSYAKYFEDSV